MKYNWLSYTLVESSITDLTSLPKRSACTDRTKKTGFQMLLSCPFIHCRASRMIPALSCYEEGDILQKWSGILLLKIFRCLPSSDIVSSHDKYIFRFCEKFQMKTYRNCNNSHSLQLCIQFSFLQLINNIWCHLFPY